MNRLNQTETAIFSYLSCLVAFRGMAWHNMAWVGLGWDEMMGWDEM
jgi:hypothetical protein